MNSRRLYRRSAPARRPEPSLHVVVRLEHDPEVHIVAGSEADARRLVYWLERSDVLDVLPAMVAATVDVLQDILDDEDVA